MKLHVFAVALALLFVLGLALSPTPDAAEPATYTDVNQMLDQSEPDIPIGRWRY